MNTDWNTRWFSLALARAKSQKSRWGFVRVSNIPEYAELDIKSSGKIKVSSL